MTTDDLFNAGIRHVEQKCDVVWGVPMRAQSSDGPNGIFGQLRLVVHLSARRIQDELLRFSRSVAALSDTVQHVVSRCAKKQMCRVAAWRVVAAVTDAKAPIERPVRQPERHPMGTDVVETPVLAHECLAVTATSRSCRPRPAVVRSAFVNVVPEGFRKGWAVTPMGTVGHVAILRLFVESR